MDKIKNEGNDITPPNPPDIIRPEKSKGNHKNNTPKKKDPIPFFTGVIAFATTVYVVVSILQWSTMQDTLKRADTSNVFTRESVDIANQTLAESKSVNKISLALTDSSLKFIKNNIRNQEKFAKIETRAYINVIGVTDFKISVGKRPTFNLKIINSGKTPAYDFRGVVSWKTGTGIYGNEIDSTDKKLIPLEGVTFGGGQTQNGSGDFNDNAPLIRNIDSTNIFSKKLDFFIFGIYAYRDIFGDEHYTRYAYVYDVGRNNFWAYKKYNDAN